MLEHSDFVEKYFTAKNAVVICKIFETDSLAEALDIFEDTREAWQVNEMLELLVPVTKKLYVWNDDEEAYFDAAAVF